MILEQDVTNFTVGRAKATLTAEGKEDVTMKVGTLAKRFYNLTLTAKSGGVVYKRRVLVEREIPEQAIFIQTDKVFKSHSKGSL